MRNPQERIVIEDYNPEWAVEFARLKAVYQRYLGHLLLNIQHVGSTSVVGLAAKPILDIDLIIPNKSFFDSVVEVLSRLGYTHRGDLGIIDREVFRRNTAATPEDGSDREWLKHHVYVCIKGSVSLQNHLLFRDVLRDHPAQAKAYGELKKQLARQYAYDIDQYIEKKTDFIVNILAQQGIDDSALAQIIAQNQAKKPPQ